MSKPDWTSIKAEYIETQLTLAELQAKWHVPRGTLSARATREKWRDERQRFAASLEETRRERILAKRAAEQDEFESNVLAVARGQLMIIARQLNDGAADAGKVLKLANALQKVQRIGSTAFGKGDS